MAARLPAWVFLSLALLLMGLAQLPLLRFVLGIDAHISMSAMTMAMLMIGGLMCGLSAMILLARRQPALHTYVENTDNIPLKSAAIHASGLLIFSGIPLANFLLCYFLWIRYRTHSKTLDDAGIAALDFLISVYLYLLISAFLVLIIVGFISTPLLLLFYAASVLAASVQALRGRPFTYPASIPVIRGRSPAD